MRRSTVQTRTKNFRTLYDRLPADRRARIEARVQNALETLALDELRAAREMTQEQLAKKLHIDQAAVSKLERRSDMYFSTLDRVIVAMGGRLEIRAVFPSGEAHVLGIGPRHQAQRKAARKRKSA